MERKAIFRVPAGMNAELAAIKRRQRQRKSAGKPGKVTNEMLYDMLFDVLENQARLENEIKALKRV